ncbi:MAG: hypothetical protein HKN31_04285 [Pricia sp.]|nr:hypothetical protein [Pricia sp.]
MKAILTLLIILTIGANALANTETNGKVNVIEVGVVLDSGVISARTATPIKVGTENSVARLYKSPNARVKKALTFTTKYHNSKLA